MSARWQRRGRRADVGFCSEGTGADDWGNEVGFLDARSEGLAHGKYGR
jgi:hypothetical protein